MSKQQINTLLICPVCGAFITGVIDEYSSKESWILNNNSILLKDKNSIAESYIMRVKDCGHILPEKQAEQISLLMREP